MPSSAVTNGRTDVEWVEVPVKTAWWIRPRPTQRLPLDPRSARRARRHIRFAPWSTAIAIGMSLAWGVLIYSGAWNALVHTGSRQADEMIYFVVFYLWVFLWSWPVVRGALPAQAPCRSLAGDLYIPEVPVGVAEQWVEQNPGVLTTNEPAPRPYTRRFYATWSAILLGAAIALWTILANDEREDPFLFNFAVPVLLVAGCMVAWGLLPQRPDRLPNWAKD
ncbi:hypothetical protein [Actinoplanes regularis]|uniref:hypothetical protein n=1 Tax=Actinoplanes regularis TaxID=52697 RepID=UPI00255309EE|nr:hypothetical protein [Actinoplanes regularis]GLW27787.1 hypothetical protein Areg01_07270 [Actinoplanes regularis]